MCTTGVRAALQLTLEASLSERDFISLSLERDSLSPSLTLGRDSLSHTHT